MKSKLKFLPFLVFIILLSQCFNELGRFGFHYEIGTYIIAFCKYIFIFYLIYLLKNKNLEKNIPYQVYRLFNWNIIWLMVTLFIGILNSTNYWDYKVIFIESLPFYFLSYSIIFGAQFELFTKIVQIIFKYVFIIGFILIPAFLYMNQEIYSRFMVPVSFMILLFPVLNLKNRFIVILVIAVSFITAFTFRSNVLKIFFSVLILVLYYFRSFISLKFLKSLILILYLSPIVLFFLGVFNIFNIFNQDIDQDKYTVNTVNFGEESMVADTRTFVYAELLKSMSDNNSFLIGEGGAAKYKTEAFQGLLSTHDKYRYASEVGILNLLLSSGIIGVVLFFLLLYVVTYTGIVHSNNNICKYLTLYIPFHWILMFIEEYSEFDMNNFIFWVVIGFIASNKFRSFSDDEIRIYFFNITRNKKIFSKYNVSKSNMT